LENCISLVVDAEDFQFAPLFEAAKAGLIGYFLHMKDSGNSLGDKKIYTPNHIFYLKDHPSWRPVSLFLRINWKFMSLEFGKVKKITDAIDLQKSGINTKDQFQKEMTKILDFLICHVAKTDNPEILRNMLLSIYKRGIVFSMPLAIYGVMFSSSSDFRSPPFNIMELNVQWKDHVCPRCDKYSRIIGSDSAIIRCRYCGTRFGTRS
jgi:hypothetical protein